MQVAASGFSPAFPKIMGHSWNYPCYVETKIDGEANIYKHGILISKASGKVRHSFPVTELLKQIVDDDTILFGELHWGEGKAGALYDFLSHQHDDKLNFTIFDVDHPTLKDKDYETRKEWLIDNIIQHPVFRGQAAMPGFIRVIRPRLIEDYQEMEEYCIWNKTDGWEGYVIKQPNTTLSMQASWVKMKHKYSEDYRVIAISPTQERMEIAINENVSSETRFVQKTCGVKLVNKYKPYVNVGDIVEIEHQGVLSGGGLRHPTFAGKVKKGASAT